ncbi:MAG TPA: aminotransferase class V-fold PLP-dependent enzyme [Edaphobacter sp.]|nr:aminotransferase class V-fold PLP-dependent enzyme [Edaphobacter sp.]
MTLPAAVAALGPGPLTEEALRLHLFPLFSRTLSTPGIYLANHSLGRPLDQTEDDLREGFRLWQTRLGDAWAPWLAEEHAHRSRIAQLIGAPRFDCIVPKTSAGQGLRTVLNALPGVPHVVSTTGEFDSIDIILKQYAAVGRIALELVDCQTPDDQPNKPAANTAGNTATDAHADAAGGIDRIDPAPLLRAIRRGVDLVVVSQVMFMTGHVLPDLPLLADACHAVGARLLVDAYHSIGVFPVDAVSLKADFMLGGSYKYLRGGPGAAFVYISPAMLASGLRPIDIGWFAKDEPFLYQRPNPPRFAKGGDAFLESTPPILTCYQARAGQQLVLALGAERIRAYNLDRLSRLKHYLADSGVNAQGADAEHGAFLTVRHPAATALAKSLERTGITTDARNEWLRLCPDLLTPDTALREAATTLASLTAAT